MFCFLPQSLLFPTLLFKDSPQHQIFVELSWTFYPLLLNVPVFMYSGCDLWRTQDLSFFFFEGRPLLRLPAHPADQLFQPLAQLKGWLTFIKCDFALRLCVGGDARDGILFPGHPRHRRVHLKVRLGRRNWRRGEQQIEFLSLYI